MSQFKLEKATKEKVKLMVGLVGPAGSGKTFSALQIAYGLTGDWSKIALADTENRSALYYSGPITGDWLHIDFPPTIEFGYHPTNWVNLIQTVENHRDIEVLILDSISHEWQGVGGCLQLVEQYSKGQRGNTFTPWNQVTPIHNSFIDKMRNSRLHIIATMRSSTEYAMELNDKGKTTPKKVGLKPTQREGTDYEFGIIFDIDINHYATSSKDRTSLFTELPPAKITSLVGEKLKAWANPVENRIPKMIAAFQEHFSLSTLDVANLVGKPLSALSESDMKTLEKIFKDLKAGYLDNSDLEAIKEVVKDDAALLEDD